MWGLYCAQCHRLLYKRKQGHINPRAVLAEVGTEFPDGSPVPRGHRMGYCTDCIADTYCRELDDLPQHAST